MISELMNKFPDSIAKVKIENKASLRLFENVGSKRNITFWRKSSVT